MDNLKRSILRAYVYQVAHKQGRSVDGLVEAVNEFNYETYKTILTVHLKNSRIVANTALSAAEKEFHANEEKMLEYVLPNLTEVLSESSQ